MESMPLSGQHAARAFWFFLQKQKERKTVPFREHFTCFFKSRTKGASGRRPLPKKHAARLFCRLRRICLLLPQQACRFAAFPAAKPLGRSLTGTFALLLKKQDKRSGRRPISLHAKRVQIYHASRVTGLLRKHLLDLLLTFGKICFII